MKDTVLQTKSIGAPRAILCDLRLSDAKSSFTRAGYDGVDGAQSADKRNSRYAGTYVYARRQCRQRIIGRLQYCLSQGNVRSCRQDLARSSLPVHACSPCSTPLSQMESILRTYLSGKTKQQLSESCGDEGLHGNYTHRQRNTLLAPGREAARVLSAELFEHVIEDVGAFRLP